MWDVYDVCMQATWGVMSVGDDTETYLEIKEACFRIPSALDKFSPGFLWRSDDAGAHKCI